MRKALLPSAMVLMYHRIDNTGTDPWNICVSPKKFEQQIEFLKSNYYVIGTTQLIEQIKQNKIEPGSICITFDDGYADNFTHAKPILEKYNCPVTFFISTAYVGKKIFWWDELEYIFLHTKKLPSHLVFEIGNKKYRCNILETALTKQQLTLHKKWRWFDNAPTTRCKAFLQIRNILYSLNFEDMNNAMQQLKTWATLKDDIPRCTMREDELQLMAQNKLFTIGLHTHTHISLKRKNQLLQQSEIVNCKKILRKDFKIHSNILAYPYGLFDKNTLHLTKELKLDACFTTKNGAVNSASNLYALNRMQVCNWNVAYFHQQLQSFSKHASVPNNCS